MLSAYSLKTAHLSAQTEVDESLVGSPVFKTVRGAVKQCWVGSIPTYLRQVFPLKNQIE